MNLNPSCGWIIHDADKALPALFKRARNAKYRIMLRSSFAGSPLP
jgi:hypothetical protein